MNVCKTVMIAMLSLSFLGTAEPVKVAIGQPAPDFILSNNNNIPFTLSQFKGKTVVLEWTNFDCPFVKKHYLSKNMQNLQQKYSEKGVIWLSICSSAKDKQGHIMGTDLEKRLSDLKPVHTAYLIDVDGKVGRLYQAKTTPHMFIIDSKGILVYAGAIDNKPSTAQEDIPGATNYVSTALEEVLAKKEVSVKVTNSYGCSIKY
jgi:peroxiredoxin